MGKSIDKRLLSLALAFVLVIAVFGVRLIQMQIVAGQSYREESDKISGQTVTSPAVRGEILDRYGRPLATNAAGYSVVLDYNALPKDTQNTVILNLTTLLAQAGETWEDSLPLSKEAPFSFLTSATESEQASYEEKIKKLKEDLRLQEYATAQNVFDVLKEKYKISGMSDADARTVVGVRREMDLRGFGSGANYTFASKISFQTATLVKENALTLPGVDIDTTFVRQYVDGTVAPHVIGTIGPIYAEEYAVLKSKGYRMDSQVGKDGIEKVMEEYLKGKDGTKVIEKNNKDQVVREYDKVKPTPGNTVVLTLDKKLQLAAQNALSKTIKSIAATGKYNEGADANAGACVVVDVRNGEILALATYPNYDLNTYKKNYSSLLADKNAPLYNRAVNGAYPPASTFKPATAVAALQSGVVSAGTSIRCTHTYNYYADKGYAPKCLGWHGNLNVTRALALSCNYFFYESGRLMGIDTMNKYMKQLGLGQPTGIEIPETTGILAGPEYRKKQGTSWYYGDTLQAAIGQSDHLFTPLQLANYAATLANGGTRYKAHLVKSVKSYSFETTVKESDPEVLDKIEISKANIDTVKEGMLEVTQDGTGSAVFSGYSVKIGGKTGSAQVPNGSDNGVFIAFAPFDEPEIAIAIVVEHGAHGSSVAPIAREVFDTYFFSSHNLGTPQQGGQLLP